MIEIPVFVINGFLESGKTTLIKDVISSNFGSQKGRTLLVVCEEGEVEYDDDFLKKYNVDLLSVESQDKMTKDWFDKMDKIYEPARVVIEFNSFYKFDLLDLPYGYVLGQTITLIDATTFNIYFNNMKQIFGDMVKYADLIIFNRTDDIKDLASYRRMVRAFNSTAQIGFEKLDGSMSDTLVEDLPYDLSSDTIDLNDSMYPTFYMDAFDNYERYYNKEISFIARLEEIEGIDDKSVFLPGRKVMTCCANDVRFLGFETTNDLNIDFTPGSYAKVVVILTHEMSRVTGQEEVILHLKKINFVEGMNDDDVLSLM